MGVSFEQVKNEVRTLDVGSKLLGWGALKELPELLFDGEHILKAIQGLYRGHQGWLIATNRRLIFLAKKGFFGSLFEDFQYSKITSIAFNKGMVLGDIIICSAGDDAVIKNCSKLGITEFCNFVRQRMEAPTTPGIAVPEAPGPLPLLCHLHLPNFRQPPRRVQKALPPLS
jgi:hypothetical protein